MIRRRYREKGIDPGWRPPTERGRELFRRYELSSFTPFFSRATFDEILGTLDLLDRITPSDPVDRPLSVLDVGSKNWAYLAAEAAWVKHRVGASVSEFSGVEIAGDRYYWDLTTRATRAEYFMESVEAVAGIHCHYQVSDVRKIQGSFDFVISLFPFVSEAPHLAWGLKPATFDPEGFHSHLRGLLKPGGVLIMANQGEWEWELARAFCSEFQLEKSEAVTGSLHPSPHTVYLSRWRN